MQTENFKMEHDREFMSRCLELANRAAGRTSPNPLVGALITKDGRILAHGYHHRAGGPHAEIEALSKIGFKAGGATLYCNLEPCFHYGRTPPCVHPIIESSITRVVIANRDPNPRTNGKSIRLLKESGVRVDEGILEKEAEFLNRFYLTWIKKNRPYVILKVAMSLDGKIAPSGSQGKWITGPESRHRVQVIRSRVDAILVGVNTVIQDNPRLNVRIKGGRQPIRIILDTNLRSPPGSVLFKNKGGPVLIATCKDRVLRGRKFEKLGASLVPLALSRNGHLSLAQLLRILAEREITSVLVEGGGKIFSSFLKSGLWDELIVLVAPSIFGGYALDAFPTLKHGEFKKPLNFHSLSFHGPDVEIRFLKHATQ